MRAPYSLGSSGLLTELLVHVAADEGDVSVLELQSAGLDQAETAALLEAGLQSESEQRNGYTVEERTGAWLCTALGVNLAGAG